MRDSLTGINKVKLGVIANNNDPTLAMLQVGIGPVFFKCLL